MAEPLTGRIELITLLPLSQGELHGQREKFLDGVFAERSPALQSGDAIDLKCAVLAGAYPEVIQRPAGKHRDAWYAAYITAVRAGNRTVHGGAVCIIWRELHGIAGQCDVANHRVVDRHDRAGGTGEQTRAA